MLLDIGLDIANILGILSKVRKPGGLAELRNVDSRKMGRLANLAPILEASIVAFRSAKVASGFGLFSTKIMRIRATRCFRGAKGDTGEDNSGAASVFDLRTAR